MTALWFCICLIEEVSKTDSASAQTYGSLHPNSLKTKAHRKTCRFSYHDKVISDLDDVIILLRLVLDLDSSHDIKVAEEGIKCFQACTLLWIYSLLM